jgi:glycosyltransferase involved in cell wall biosynthesis
MLERVKVLFTAAHGGFRAERVPLGGGAAVCEQLRHEWERTRPFELEMITPAILGGGAPRGRDLTRFSEREYAEFCRAFERAVTARILAEDPARTVVLANDVSEGPAFAALAARGFAVYTIYHVDVVDYVASIYARGWVRPETLIRWYGRLRGVSPKILRLIFDKQRDSVEHSRGLIVPSQRMRDTLARCYPGAASKTHVIPWGTWTQEPNGASGAAALRAAFGIPENARVLLTLSRISPEKGQDLLLESLAAWERRGDLPREPLWLFICGEAAFMQGDRFLAKLRKLAGRLRRIQVRFPGYVTGARKQAFFALADLYVFPSRHESYGLTLLEALHAGLPAVCCDHHGAREVMREEFGVLTRPDGLADAIRALLGDEARRTRMAAAARAFARSQAFSRSAARLAALLAARP